MADGSKRNAKAKAKRSASSSNTSSRKPQAKRTASSSRASSSKRANGKMSALEAAGAAREQLEALLGRPVEAVLGAERDGGDWVVKAQVLELARVPNTTDVLGEYETVIDRSGDVVRYARTQRYHRGQVDGER